MNERLWERKSQPTTPLFAASCLFKGGLHKEDDDDEEEEGVWVTEKKWFMIKKSAR